MGKCMIFCAGDFDGNILPVERGDCVIAADGGLRHVQALGIEPDIILGDFDSLGYIPEGAAVYPVEKDDTDAMLAVRKGLSLGYKEFLLYGSLEGKRLDHTLANFQTLSFLAKQGARGYLVGLHHIATAVKNGCLNFSEGCGGVFSLFCLGPDARGITLTGFQYPLEKAVLTSDFPLGVSNHFSGSPACVEVSDGTLLAIWDKENGLPAQTSPERRHP